MIEAVFGDDASATNDWALLVHGGAGDVPAARAAAHVAGCRHAAALGGEILRRGGSALDAAEAAVRALEDDPSFNAGTGACLDESGAIALDAAIMEGRALRAGGVCALPAFRNPISIARAALEDARHVLYAGEGAAAFAEGRGFARADERAMITDAAREQWAAVRRGEAETGWAGGTVGAVARDAAGLVVAATSTGGTTAKRRGRVGDTPLVGAGTYADDEGGAASNTGHGEGVIRTCLGFRAVEWMREGQLPRDAARRAIELLGERVGSRGGVILVDRAGRIGFARSTRTMSWGASTSGLADAIGGL